MFLHCLLSLSLPPSLSLPLSLPPSIAPPVITLTPPRNTIAYTVAGTPFQITCTDMSAVPAPVFTWFFNDTPVTNNTNGFIIQTINANVSVLSIEDTGLDHAGVYKCESTNPAGTDNEELELVIQRKYL